MKSNIKIIINYNVISKKNLGLYFIILWLVFTFIVVPDMSNIKEKVASFFGFLVFTSVLFALRIILDFIKMKKLNPNISSSVQITKAVNYLEKLKNHGVKTTKKNNYDLRYMEFVKAYNELLIYYKNLMEGVDCNEY